MALGVCEYRDCKRSPPRGGGRRDGRKIRVDNQDLGGGCDGVS